MNDAKAAGVGGYPGGFFLGSKDFRKGCLCIFLGSGYGAVARKMMDIMKVVHSICMSLYVLTVMQKALR